MSLLMQLTDVAERGRLEPITGTINVGEILHLVGPNGAGKSTTIRMLCGIIVPTAGKANVLGYDVFEEAEKIKAQIGYMSQKFSLYEDLTVEENIDFYSGIYQIPQAEKNARKKWVIKMSGLDEHRNSLTSVLAGGWRQRLALGCALLHKPPVIFLDEPTSGVDPISRRNFWDLIYELAAEGVTVFVTTHNPLVLDGLDLMNDDIRLFAVNKSRKSGHTSLQRIQVTKELMDSGYSLSRLWTEGRLGGVPNL